MGCCCAKNNCCGNSSSMKHIHHQDQCEMTIPEGHNENIPFCCSCAEDSSCICLPYQDGFAMMAQILSIVALLFSWIWWVTFVVSLVGTVSFLFLWCKRMSTRSLCVYVWMARGIAIFHFGLALYCWIALRRTMACKVFHQLIDDDDDNNYNYNYYWYNDSCNEKLFGFLALVCSLLWTACSLCLSKFVSSGRHAKWEEQHYGRPVENHNNKNKNKNKNGNGEKKANEETPAAIEIIPEEELVIEEEVAYNYKA